MEQEKIQLDHLNKYQMPILKCVLVGDSGVGKTIFLNSYTNINYDRYKTNNNTSEINKNLSKYENKKIKMNDILEINTNNNTIEINKNLSNYENKKIKINDILEINTNNNNVSNNDSNNDYDNNSNRLSENKTNLYIPTTLDNYEVKVQVNDKPIKLQICDTAGKNEFAPLRALSFLDADVFLLFFNIVNVITFENINSKWLPEIKKINQTAPIVLVGIHSDLRSNLSISRPIESILTSSLNSKRIKQFMNSPKNRRLKLLTEHKSCEENLEFNLYNNNNYSNNNNLNEFYEKKLKKNHIVNMEIDNKDIQKNNMHKNGQLNELRIVDSISASEASRLASNIERCVGYFECYTEDKLKVKEVFDMCISAALESRGAVIVKKFNSFSSFRSKKKYKVKSELWNNINNNVTYSLNSNFTKSAESEQLDNCKNENNNNIKIICGHSKIIVSHIDSDINKHLLENKKNSKFPWKHLTNCLKLNNNK